ncbi:MAG: thioesterase family protein [Gammaproteobacteria bacterium]|nr:thioesterase family protein [Gammaproteobacteria bacterium]
MPGFLDTFAGRKRSDSLWSFELEEHFNGAFGGTNGGVLSALSVYVARVETERRPASIDSRYIRGFRPGTARVEVTTIRKGRTLSVLGIDIFDGNDRLCTHSVITLVEQSGLAENIQHLNQVLPAAHLATWKDGKLWRQPTGQIIPLIDTFEPRSLGGNNLRSNNLRSKKNETATATKVVWQEPGTSAEAACIAADISVGPPVARAVQGGASTPNPDLSLRFCGTNDPGEHLIALCELRSIVSGLASTSISVWNRAELLAVGVSSTTCLPL